MRTTSRMGFTGIVKIPVAAIITYISIVAAASRADEAPQAPASTGKCMMWKVSSKTATVYLLGSMHMATPEMYPLPKEVEDAFAKSDLLVVEVNINKVDQAKLGQMVQEKGIYEGDKTLSGSISKETWNDVKEACQALNFPTLVIDKMKPWTASLVIETVGIQKLGFDPKLGIDQHFLDMADKKKEPVEELESADFQINLLAGFDEKQQEESLELAVTEMKDIKKDMTQMTDAWIAGDGKTMEQLMTKAEKKHPAVREVVQKMIYDRNGPMAQKVEGYLKGDKNVLVIAGCAHMIGEKGIIKILEKDKFEVEQSPSTKQAKSESPAH